MEAGIDVQLFDADLQREIRVLDRRFLQQFLSIEGVARKATEFKVGGISWQLEHLFGASWSNRDPTTARVSTFQLIGENQSGSAVAHVSGELATAKGTIPGSLNRDGDLESPDALLDVPPMSPVILVFPLVEQHWKDGVALLDLPRIAPFELSVVVDGTTEKLRFSRAETADMVAAFISKGGRAA